MERVQFTQPIEQYAIDVATKLRKDHGLYARDIAGILHTSVSFIFNVESSLNSAKYNLKHINALSAYFQVSPQIFLPKYSIQPNTKYNP
ncbi:hypothetical protein SAMN06265348_1243 [Pedobacter westerhofensis]|uniref:HTH cro/C1-type domain-containing protein n=1 Tax=Pedobacter westerhofensis TaxID=425512 RepID=A0A521FTW4_9SPHI|nr:hypothetical protein SAMN06265348_1243 [Pedobacter westerhofensis]